MIISALTIAAGTYGALGLLLFAVQRNILFQPTPAPEEVPYLGWEQFLERPGLKIQARELVVSQGEARLRITLVNPGRENLLIYFGGNAEQIELNAGDFSELFPQWTIALVNYRSYGGSTGTPSKQAVLSDALEVYDSLSPGFARVAVGGRSLGTGPAAWTARERPVDRAVFITPYAELSQVAASHIPLFPISLMLRDNFTPARWLEGSNLPALLLLAENDEVVAPAHGKKFYETFAPGAARVEMFAGMCHNTIENHYAYADIISGFFRVE